MLNDAVLLTLVGSSDPIRNNYDGPLLHICRVMRPKKVYMILTPEMHDRDEIDDRYVRAIHEQVHEGIDVIKLEEVSLQVYNFDAFFVPIHAHMTRMKDENPGSKLLVNITSGTTQFISALAMMISYASEDIQAVQVLSPEGAANKSATTGEDYDLELELEMNIDNLGSFVNRLAMPNLDYYKKILVVSQVKSLIAKYQYSAAVELLKLNSFSSTRVNTILNIADQRLKLNTQDINSKLSIFEHDRVKWLYHYPTAVKTKHAPNWYRLIEYFNATMVRAEADDYAAYVLMLEPFTFKLYQFIIEDVMFINFKNLFDFDKRKDKYTVNRSKLSEELLQFIEDSLKSKLDEKELSTKVMIPIIHYNSSKAHNPEFIDEFNELSGLLKKAKHIRNSVAHNLVSLNRNDFYKEVDMTSNELNNKVKTFLTKYITNSSFNKDMFNVYEHLNDFICEQLDEMV